MIRVVIADDQGLVRVSLRKVLEVEPDIEVMGRLPTGGKLWPQRHGFDPT
jgi:DNA-binding NarL/FixJ family response regulator